MTRARNINHIQIDMIVIEMKNIIEIIKTLEIVTEKIGKGRNILAAAHHLIEKTENRKKIEKGKLIIY